MVKNGGGQGQNVKVKDGGGWGERWWKKCGGCGGRECAADGGDKFRKVWW